MRDNQPPIRSRLRRGSLLCAAAVSVFVACGGKAIVDAPPGNQAGASSIAGASPVAGANSAAGANPAAGANSAAGANPVGGSSSLAGASPTAGAGGAVAVEACTANQDSGPCNAYIPSFWHDPATHLCVPFVYGGCGGNANRYPSREACTQACSSESDDWTACVNDSNCTLISASCCDQCEPVASEALIAINRANAATYTNARCLGAGACLPCMPVAENKQTGKYLKAVCRNRQCAVLDVRQSPITECKNTSDCRLRDGASCCAECDGSGWVAVNNNADLCGGVPAACDDCVSPPPRDWDASCVSGRCQLTLDAPL
jgi:hypothetical protein